MPNHRISYTIKHPLIKEQFDALKARGYSDTEAMDAILERATMVLKEIQQVRHEKEGEIAYLREQIEWLKGLVQNSTGKVPTACTTAASAYTPAVDIADDDAW